MIDNKVLQQLCIVGTGQIMNDGLFLFVHRACSVLQQKLHGIQIAIINRIAEKQRGAGMPSNIYPVHIADMRNYMLRAFPIEGLCSDKIKHISCKHIFYV